MKLHIIAFLFIAMAACSTSKTTSVAQIGDYEKLAEDKLGANVTFEHSPEDEYVLCYKNNKGTVKFPQNTIEYIVYDLKKNEVIKEDTFGPGEIKWYDAKHLEIFQIPGVMPEGKTKDHFTYLYNVETGERTQKSEI